MYRYYLQINPGKTEFIVFGSPSVLSSIMINGVFINGGTTCIRLSPVVKNLGFYLDSELTFKYQVSKLKSALFHKLKNIGRMKIFLTQNQLCMLIQSVIMLSLDYCNSLYYGCSKKVIEQLQMIQNRACRIIFGMKKRESTDEKMKSLHWLKIQQRIEFKILLLVFKSLRITSAPTYLSDLFYGCEINNKRAITLHAKHPAAQNPRAFQVVGARLWNNLPLALRQISEIEIFKNRLKTHLFGISYGNHHNH